MHALSNEYINKAASNLLGEGHLRRASKKHQKNRDFLLQWEVKLKNSWDRNEKNVEITEDIESPLQDVIDLDVASRVVASFASHSSKV
jgi:hypothetical protein